MSKKAEPGSRLGRWLGAPVRALSRASDSYVRWMSSCAGRMPTNSAAYGGRGAGLAPGSLHAATFSSRSSRRGRGGEDDDDVGELVRAMSQRQASRGRAAEADAVVPVRSRSVAAVGRIDEDAPCEFGADDDVFVRVGGPPPVRRARSVAVGGAGLSSASARAARVRASCADDPIPHATAAGRRR